MLAERTGLVIQWEVAHDLERASIDGWLRALGLALIGHAVILFWASGQDNLKRWTWLNFLAIAPYPLGLLNSR